MSWSIKIEGLWKQYRRGGPVPLSNNFREDIVNTVRSLLGRTIIKKEDESQFWALQDINLNVAEGEILGLIGRNGAGKSTLLKILSRITVPTRGKVTYTGRVASLLEVGTGFHRELTGRENIFLNGSILGMRRKEIERKFDDIVAFAEVEKFIDTPVKFYSTGMFIRLAFAVAAHLESDILLVDEVLAVGDAVFQKKCLGKMGDVARNGRTVVLVSHNMSSILSLCTKVAYLEKGRLATHGDPKEVVQAYLHSAMSATNEATPLESRQDRWGDGTARFVGIEISSADDEKVIRSTSRLKISLRYRSDRPLLHPTFWITVYDFSNTGIFLFNSDSVGGLAEVLPTEGVVTCITEPINLTPGRCYLNIALIKGGAMIDHVEYAASFDVEPDDVYQMGKVPSRDWVLCVLQHQWSVEEKKKKQISSVTPIPHNEVEFHPSSFADPNGRLFHWQGDIYRGITRPRKDFYARLFQDRIVEKLVGQGLLVETELTPYSLAGYEMVLRHRRLPFVTYAYEWPAAMLKQATLLIIRLQSELVEHKLTLQDAHPWNVLFHGAKPVFVDFGSIIPADGGGQVWSAYEELLRFGIFPLQLMEAGHGRIARALLHDFDAGVQESDVEALLDKPVLHQGVRRRFQSALSRAGSIVPHSMRPTWRKTVAAPKRLLAKSAPGAYHFHPDSLSLARRKVDSIVVPPGEPATTEPPVTLSPDGSWNAKQRNLLTILESERPRTVLDIGCHQGWVSQLAALAGADVVAFDRDEPSVNSLFVTAQEKDLPITPLVMDFRNPSPGYGICNRWSAPATDRFRSDLVFALGVIRHLVFRYQITFDQIVEGLAAFAKKTVVVEFCPANDPSVSPIPSVDYSWHSLENFEKTLAKSFPSIQRFESWPESRKLLLCRKSG